LVLQERLQDPDTEEVNDTDWLTEFKGQEQDWVLEMYADRFDRKWKHYIGKNKPRVTEGALQSWLSSDYDLKRGLTADQVQTWADNHGEDKLTYEVVGAAVIDFLITDRDGDHDNMTFDWYAQNELAWNEEQKMVSTYACDRGNDPWNIDEFTEKFGADRANWLP